MSTASEGGRRRRQIDSRAGAALRDAPMPKVTQSRSAKFAIGQVVKHRVYPFRGVIYDVDPVFANTEEWYRAIPAEIRPSKDQPFYHLFAENADDAVCRLCLGAELAARRFRAAGAPSSGRATFHARRPGVL